MSLTDESLAELFEQYKEEVRETIGVLDNELVAIEQDPASNSTIFSLFRHMHSLKGSSKMFHVDNIAHIAHRLEDLMSLIDKDNSILARHPRIIELLFRGNDIFRAIIAKLEDDINYINLTPEHSGFIEEIQNQIDRIQRRDGAMVEAARKLLESLEQLLPHLEESEADNLRKEMDNLASGVALATLEENGSGARIKLSYGGRDLSAPISAIEDVLNKIKASGETSGEASGEASADDARELLSCLKNLHKVLFEVAGEDIMSLMGELSDGLELFETKNLTVDEVIVTFFSELLKDLKKKFQVELTGRPAAGGQPPKDKAPPKEQSKTIRVDETKIDQFLDSVGKLITKSEILNHLQHTFRQAGIGQSLIRDFTSVSRTISTDIVNLQKSIMEVRQVEMDNILKKFPRLVRDLVHKIGKEAELNITGERVPIDKSLLDDVEQALVHIVRNAADHGLESPEEREAAGKNRRGAINISVIAKESSILIEVSDDGRGLDLQKILVKAVERGLVTQAEADAMPDKEAEMLIFRAGVSTKDQATDLSGRGVGMDVVMTNLRKWNGEVMVDNRPGQGLTISLNLPVTNTLLTKEALLLRVCEHTFCVPLEFVAEIVTVGADDLHQHKDKLVFRHRDMVISVINLRERLALAESSPSSRDEEAPTSTFVILRNKDNAAPWSIMADDILGQQKIVIKEFDIDSFRRLPYFNGLTLLGDGRVVLILDAESLTAD